MQEPSAPASDPTMEHRLAACGATARDRGPRWMWGVVDEVVGCPAVVATIAYFA